jgi:hypothetical protein
VGAIPMRVNMCGRNDHQLKISTTISELCCIAVEQNGLEAFN